MTKHRRSHVAIMAGLAVVATSYSSSVITRASAATSKVPLVIYAAEGYDTNVAKAFQDTTGIPTSVYDAHTGIVVSKIEAEKNNPHWALTWFDGDMAMASLDQQGLLLRGYEPTEPLTSVGAKFTPKDKSYIPTGYTIAATILYNSKALSRPPTTWTDLTKASYRGRLGILNPAIDGPAYPLLAGWAVQFGGVPRMETYLKGLVKNGAKLYSSPDDELNAIKQGIIDVAFAQSSYGIGVNEKQANLKVAYPQSVTPVPSVIGIDAKASPAVVAEAKQFAQFVLSARGQVAMQAGDPHGDSLYWPVVASTPPLSALPSPATIPSHVLDAAKWGRQENIINQWFTSNIAR